ncbi:MAG: hypothetical protein RRY79_06200 [Clostridia bacterium]
MHSNIGKKIKILAKIIVCGGVCLSILFGMLTIVTDASLLERSISPYKNSFSNAWIGIAIIIIGCVSSFVLSLIFYKLGVHIEEHRENDKK